MFKNKFKKLTGLFLAAVMTLVALPIQTLASEWGVGDNVYAAMLGNYIGSDGGTYGDKRNYTFIYYKADGDVATATRVKSNHAKLGVSKNGVTQQATAAQLQSLYKSLKFSVKNSDGKYVTAKATSSDGVYTFSGSSTTPQYYTVNSNGAFRIDEVPTGSYAITETACDNKYTPAHATVTAKVTANATVTSDYPNNRKIGTGRVTKTLDNASALTADEKKDIYASIRFTVKTSDGKYVAATATASPGVYNYNGTSNTAHEYKINSNGVFRIDKMPTGTYFLTETSCDDNYTPSVATKKFTVRANETTQVSYENTRDKGSLRVQKSFSDSDNLTTAQKQELYKTLKFTVKDSDGKYVTAKATSSDGVYTFSGSSTTPQYYTVNSNGAFRIDKVPTGSYAITETACDNRYTPAHATVTAKVTANATVTSDYPNNRKIGTGRVTKTLDNASALTADEKKDIYASIRFTVKTADGKYVTATKAVEVTTDAVTTVNFENKPYANIVINKVDSVTNSALSGATFGIYSDADCKIPAQAYTSETDDTLIDAVITEAATGKYTCDYLPIESKDGTTYYVKELKAPEHYAIDTNVYPVTLKTANSTIAVSNNGTSQFIETPLGSVRTIKVDKDYPDNKLTGAGFTVYKSDKSTAYGNLTEVATGEYQLDEIPAGVYYLKETKAPLYYNIDNTYYQFVILNAGEVVNVETNAGKGFENDAMTGSISVVKHSADGKLSGWQFRVTGTAKTGQSYDKIFTTDANGTITISNIRIGDYKVTEVKTGKTVGYITEDSKAVEVTTDAVTTVNFENKRSLTHNSEIVLIAFGDCDDLSKVPMMITE